MQVSSKSDNTRLSPEWEAKFEKLYDLGMRRLRRARGIMYKPVPNVTSKWDLRFYQLIENHRRKVSGKTSLWNRKLGSLVSCWNIWFYQLKGQAPTITNQLYKKHKDWQSRYFYMLSRFNQEHKKYGWERKFDTLRRIWTDTGKQIKGGIGNMDTELENERLGINDLRQMKEEQNCICALTGRPLTYENCSLDHIIPLARGGKHIRDNAQLVCEEANRAKGMMTEEEFLDLCQDVVNYRCNKYKK